MVMLVAVSAACFAQMTDEQVIDYLQNAKQQGLSQQEVQASLLQRGVTREQIARLRAQYGSSQAQGGAAATATADAAARLRTTTPIRESVSASGVLELLEPDNEAVRRDSMLRYLFDPGVAGEKKIFGHDVFTNRNLTFEPNLSIATPENYLLGPGDEVFIDMWGDSELNVRQVISPDGRIIIPKVGPVMLAGLTVKNATHKVMSELERTNQGLNTGNVSLDVSVGKIRNIQVNVMGEVRTPGTYTMPSLATLFHALYLAGGVTDLGSLRSIKVYRGGRRVADVDVYDYILSGKTSSDVALRNGDVVVVSPYVNLVEIKGKVKRPMIYEMRAGESLDKLIGYAGGMAGDANPESVSVERMGGDEYRVFNVARSDFGSFKMGDKDVVTVGSTIPRFENRVEVKGAVYREGVYALDDEVKTVRQLIEKASGLRADAFTSRGVLYRERPDWTLEVESVDVQGVMDGTAPDIELRNNDVLYISSNFDMQETPTVSIFGSVGQAGTYPYAENMSVEDLIVAAGGLKEDAAVINIDVARRIKDPKSLQVNDVRNEVFSVSLKDGLGLDGDKGFILEPFDQVYVRRSPSYTVQSNVSVSGQVVFGGNYALNKRGDRLSDVIKRAGGLTPDAYAAGAHLERRLSAAERKQAEALLKLLRRHTVTDKDTTTQDLIEVEDTYPVGIDLRMAMLNPGSDWDVVLRDGDRIVVPEYDGTVKIQGAVMYPNTVMYNETMSLKKYVKMAGGFSQNAKRGSVFVIYMNGMMAAGKHAKVTPGSIIVVPAKLPTNGVRLSDIMSVATSTVSMAAMVTAISK